MWVHHPARHSGNSYRMVGVTSSALGSLKLDNNILVPNGYDNNTDHKRDLIENSLKNHENGYLLEIIREAKLWSSMMQDRILKITPKTPTWTPPGQPETINTREMMEGLEDISPFHSFSIEATTSPPQIPLDQPESKFQESGRVLESASTKPFWLQTEESDDNVPDGNCKVLEFDLEIISAFRKLQVSLDVLECTIQSNSKVVVYYTTLRGVRKTYDDCFHVRTILKGLGFRVDERDVSMHSEFKDELKELLGGISLPKVFLGKNCLGGADEIRKLHDEGQLEKVLEGCEMVEDYKVNGGGHACEACGDVRFLLCDTCSGSRKVYYEFDQEDHEAEHKESEGEESELGFQRCPDCNENGLIRCPICCY